MESNIESLICESNIEREANKYAASMCLEYLKEVNEYDLRELGEQRFKTLIEVITNNYHQKFAELEEDSLNDCPF